MAGVDQAVINQAKRDYDAAKKKGDKTGMEAAHAVAEAERARGGGYSGGVDGSQRIVLNENQNARTGGSVGLSGGSGSDSEEGSKVITTITMPDGSMRSGYIQNEATYFDDGSRITDGSQVTDNAGRIWRMENGKGVQIGSQKGGETKDQTEWEKLSNSASAKYNELLAQQDAITDANTKIQVSNLERTIDKTNKNYDQAAREAYIQYMQGKKALPDALAAAGQTGGATESGNLKLETGYQSNTASINKERASALKDIDDQINTAYAEGNVAKMSNAATIAAQAADTYLDLMREQMQVEYDAGQQSKDDELAYYLKYIEAFANDPQSEIDRLIREGVSDYDPRILALKSLVFELGQAAEEEKTSVQNVMRNAGQKSIEATEMSNGVDENRYNASIVADVTDQVANLASETRKYDVLNQMYQKGKLSLRELNTILKGYDLPELSE